MPELPEVETVRAELELVTKGKRIASLALLREKNLLSPKEEFIEALTGASIVAVERKGKCLRFDFDRGYSLYSHLRMEGKYFLYPSQEPLQKFDLLVFYFEDGTSLRYNDTRKFGTFTLGKKDDPDSPFSKIGPEPFDIEGAYLYEKWKKKTTPVKIALLDQTVISGIGNIYDSEILFAAKVSPFTPVKDLSLDQCNRLIAEARRILNAAIKAGGTTIRSFHHGGIDGLFQFSLIAYGKEGKPCPNCSRPIKRVFQGGRSTYYCPTCQKGKNDKFVLGVTGPIHAGKSTVSAFYEGKGYLHFDADKVASNFYYKAKVKPRIKKILGKESYLNGELNRDYVREVLAKDKKKKKALQNYLYPLVKLEASRFIEKARPETKILLDVPLLFDAKMEDLCTYTLLIDAPLHLRLKRLEEEGRPTAALAKLNKEYHIEQAKEKADFVLINDADLDSLQKKLEDLGF